MTNQHEPQPCPYCNQRPTTTVKFFGAYARIHCENPECYMQPSTGVNSITVDTHELTARETAINFWNDNLFGDF